MKPELTKGDHILIFNPIERQLVAYGVFHRYDKEGNVKTVLSYVPESWMEYGTTFSKDFGFILINNTSCTRIVSIVLKHYRNELQTRFRPKA